MRGCVCALPGTFASANNVLGERSRTRRKPHRYQGQALVGFQSSSPQLTARCNIIQSLNNSLSINGLRLISCGSCRRVCPVSSWRFSTLRRAGLKKKFKEHLPFRSFPPVTERSRARAHEPSERDRERTAPHSPSCCPGKHVSTLYIHAWT